LCYLACYNIIYLVQKCNCYDPSLPNWSILKSTQPCLSFFDSLCAQQAYFYFFSHDVKKVCQNECPLECNSVDYATSVSYASYPSKVYGSILAKNPQLQAKFISGSNASAIDFNDLKETLVAFNVYYDDLSYKSFIELEKTSLVDLVASIGGTLGLFLGMSFLSFVELIDLLFLIGLTLVEFKCKHSSKISNI
jgi:hypothetical protein